MIKINKEKIFEIKEVVSELMEKKAELQSQIHDFKDSINEIKCKKNTIVKMIDDSKKDKLKENRVWARVREKR